MIDVQGAGPSRQSDGVSWGEVFGMVLVGVIALTALGLVLWAVVIGLMAAGLGVALLLAGIVVGMCVVTTVIWWVCNR